MSLGAVESVDGTRPLATAVENAFERIRSSGASGCALVFDPTWQPTMDVVELVAQALSESEDVQTVTLVHPSAAMSFIASAIAARVPGIGVSARRSVYDEPEDETTDATASKTMFAMEPQETAEAFIRRAVHEARRRRLRRFALCFHASWSPALESAAVLAEELLHSGVEEIGLVHPSAPIAPVGAALRLRLPGVRVACAGALKRP